MNGGKHQFSISAGDETTNATSPIEMEFEFGIWNGIE